MKEDNSLTENDFDHHMITRQFPLALAMLMVYTPYSFFYSNDYLAGILQFISLTVLITLKVKYEQIKNLNLLKDTLIFLGFPVLIPWLLSGGPVDHGLWWTPTYVLWVSFYAKGGRFFKWLSAFVLANVIIVVLSLYGILTIAYSVAELLHILFAFAISAGLIHYYELWRAHYKERLEEELKIRIQTQDKYRQLLDTAPDAIIVSNIKGEIVMMNMQAEKIFGYSYSELIGQKISMLIPDHLGPKHMEHVKGYFSNPTHLQNVSGDRFFARHKNGQDFPIELSLSLNKDERVVTAVIRNVTERHFMTQQLVTQNAQLNDFAHMASHDLRGPVGNLKTIIEFLREESNPEQQQLLMKTATAAIHNLEDTLNNLLEIVSYSNHPLEPEDVYFDQVMQKLLDTYAPDIANTQASVSFSFDKTHTLRYPPVYLESIMQNLLSNALKYKSPNRTPMIHFESNFQNGQTRLTVSDNGQGLDLDKYGHKLFGLKETFHNHPSSKGIGLYLIKSHIEQLGGSITMTSKVDVGTAVTVVFNKKA